MQPIPGPNQIWRHNTYGVAVVIQRIAVDGNCYCAVIDDRNKKKAVVTSKLVCIPITKFNDMGNRGLRFVADKGGRLLVASPPQKYGEYKPRNKWMGAK